MIAAYQSCRICGIRVPAGFTNCNSCYYKSDGMKADDAGRLSSGSGPAKQKLIIVAGKRRDKQST
jgi:ribosomal protein L40E